MTRALPRLLGIDPGTTESAWVIWDGARVLDHRKEPNRELLQRLRENAFAFELDGIAIEMVASYGMPVGQTVFQTCVWIGRFIEAARRPVLPPVYRLAVKMELCHDSRAKDPAIRRALLDRCGPQGSKASPGPTYGLARDAWAALGVAIVAAKEASL